MLVQEVAQDVHCGTPPVLSLLGGLAGVWPMSNKEPTSKILVPDFDEKSAWISDDNLEVRFVKVKLFAICRMTNGLAEIDPKLHSAGFSVMPPTDSDHIAGH